MDALVEAEMLRSVSAGLVRKVLCGGHLPGLMAGPRGETRDSDCTPALAVPCMECAAPTLLPHACEVHMDSYGRQ